MNKNDPIETPPRPLEDPPLPDSYEPNPDKTPEPKPIEEPEQQTKGTIS